METLCETTLSAIKLYSDVKFLGHSIIASLWLNAGW